LKGNRSFATVPVVKRGKREIKPDPGLNKKKARKKPREKAFGRVFSQQVKHFAERIQ